MPKPVDRELIVHASAVAFGARGVLILGASGAGKSALALKLMAQGARLVADDRVILSRRGRALVARAPTAIAGMIEARGLGLLRAEAAGEAVVALAVDLDRAPAARMPQCDTIAFIGTKVELILGRDVPNLEVALRFLVQNRRAGPERGAPGAFATRRRKK